METACLRLLSSREWRIRAEDDLPAIRDPGRGKIPGLLDDQLGFTAAESITAAQLEARGAGTLSQFLRELAVALDNGHAPIPAARLRRLRVLGAVGLLRVVVVAAARLPAHPACRDQARLDRARLPAGLAERELHERLRHLEADVDAHQAP